VDMLDVVDLGDVVFGGHDFLRIPR